MPSSMKKLVTFEMMEKNLKYSFFIHFCFSGETKKKIMENKKLRKCQWWKHFQSVSYSNSLF